MVVGIDLGTTNSVVSVLDDELNPVTLEIDGNKLLPSVVSLTPNGYIVGQTAKNMLALEPLKTVASIKRKMGQDILVPLGDQNLRPEEISAIILDKIKQSIQQSFRLAADEKIRAVITVPAYFSEEQRDATKESAELAGYDVIRIINEPTAAALAFGLSKSEEAVFAVYDLGGGTFDVSVIETMDGLVEVLASSGNNLLGGDDIDEKLAAYILKKFLEVNNLPPVVALSITESARLLRIAERTKIQLSTEVSSEISESFFANIKGHSYHIELIVTRAELEELIRPLIEETVEHLRKAVKEAKLSLNNLDGILLVGGSSRIPMITTMIEEELFIAPILVDLPDEFVAHGAALQGGIIDGKDINTVLVDITPHSLGMAVLNPELVWGFGSTENALEFAVLIAKNTPIPAKKTHRFSATTSFQEKYQLRIGQGESKLFSGNKCIGQSLMTVENPVEDGLVDVTFSLDINGILHVTAIEPTTGDEVEVNLQSARGKKVNQNKLNHLKIVHNSADSPKDNALLLRANALLESKKLNEEDAHELKALALKLESALESDNEAAAGIETELLDLLYFLENN